jgi:hypothetical protein
MSTYGAPQGERTVHPKPINPVSSNLFSSLKGFIPDLKSRVFSSLVKELLQGTNKFLPGRLCIWSEGLERALVPLLAQKTKKLPSSR